MSDIEAETAACPCPWAQRDAAVFLHQTGSSPVVRTITAAEGARFRDSTGHWVYDLHGNGCHHLGYGHPRLVAAVEHQLRTLPFAPRRFTNPQAVALAEALVMRWPGGAGRVLFAPSGSDAIDIALKLARLATGRPGTIAFEGAWHGAGMGPLAVGGRASERPSRLGPLVGSCWHVPGYDPWADGDALDRSAAASVDAVAHVLAARCSPARLCRRPDTGPRSARSATLIAFCSCSTRYHAGSVEPGASSPRSKPASVLT